ncbi:MAG: hypothetical protein ACAH88_00795, partial [Roseimicrobium sp.]
QLVRTVFEGAFNRLPADLSRDILDEFKKTPGLEPFMARAPDINGQARLLRDLSALAKAFDRLPPSHLEQRLRTGVDGDFNEQAELPLDEITPEPAVIELPDDLLAALEEEGGQPAQVAGVARRLSAVLHVPKPVSQQDDLPVGGVSDITNRGEPDRLLLTELAWDDLTFATRLAQGEALYTRRESPPSEPPPRRKILLDTGIHLWGKPRLFALGAVLALLRHSRKPISSGEQSGEVYALADDTFEPISLRTVLDVRTQLSRLEPTPFPAAAVADFVQKEMQRSEPGEEVFLVSHPDAMESLVREKSWQQLAAKCLLHTIQVDRHGMLLMSRHTVAGARALAQVQIDLDALLQSPPDRRPSAVLTDEIARLPSFYKHYPWPLYYPVTPSGQMAFEVPQTIHNRVTPEAAFVVSLAGHVGVTSDRCVCYWRPSAQCGRVLWPYAPGESPERVVIVDGAEPGLVGLAFENSGRCKLVICDVHGRTPALICSGSFSAKIVSGIFQQSGALVVYHLQGCDAFSADNGTELLRYRGTLPRQRWFDGSSFHQDARPVPLSEKLAATRLRRPTRTPRHTNLQEVGFGRDGGLYFRKQSGSVYHLGVARDGMLCWRVSTDTGINFRRLERFPVPAWPVVHLAQAEFVDGRRVVFDSRGFLHVVDPLLHQELSILVVKGNTAAWSGGGDHFGERGYLWNDYPVSQGSPQALCTTLFRAAFDVPYTSVTSAAGQSPSQTF